MRPATLALLLALSPSLLSGQPLAERYAALGTIIVTTSDHTMFPHPKRANGYVYEGKTYPADRHYSDRTVVIFVPKGFRPGETTDIVFYFHGWWNNVDRTLATFRIAEQLGASGVNAVLVLAEGRFAALKVGLEHPQDAGRLLGHGQAQVAAVAEVGERVAHAHLLLSLIHISEPTRPY